MTDADRDFYERAMQNPGNNRNKGGRTKDGRRRGRISNYEARDVQPVSKSKSKKKP